MPRPLLALLFLSLPLAGQVRMLVIGDSLSDEYGAVADLADIPLLSPLLGGSVYPQPDPPSDNPRAFNWPELLSIKRGSEVDFGPAGTWSSYFTGGTSGDLRLKGYERNFAIVGTTTFNWVILLGTEDPPPFDLPGDDFPLNLLYYETRTSLLEELPNADVVVIMLGGNDLKNDYNDLFNDAEPATFFSTVVARLSNIHAFLRSRRPGVPIVVATVPDVGATPNLHDVYDVPAQQATTRAKIAAMNESIAGTFAAKPATAVARVDRLTDEILDIVLGVEPGPFDLNGTPFVIGGDPANPPDHLFCKDTFHPGTAAQALIANEIIEAIHSLGLGPITPFSHREILGELLGLDPDQPYLDWIAGYDLSLTGMDEDPDGDGLPSLVEMGLGTPPDAVSPPLWGDGATGLSWTPDPDALRYLRLDAEESTDLLLWEPVPPERISEEAGSVTATPPTGLPRAFLRLDASPRP